jgi:four helix bundle protein
MLGKTADMNPDQFKQRTKSFAISIMKFAAAPPRTSATQIIARQLVRSGTSVGANYRAACRAKSRADFIAKMGIVEVECDECMYWIELLIESKAVDAAAVQELMHEANEILSIVVSSIRTARSRN